MGILSTVIGFILCTLCLTACFRGCHKLNQREDEDRALIQENNINSSNTSLPKYEDIVSDNIVSNNIVDEEEQPPSYDSSV